MNLLDPEELARLLPAEEHAYASPIPTQSVSSDEFMPGPQTTAQRRVEARIKELGGDLARKQGMTRRRFLQTASGMAAAFVAMNEVYGRLFDASLAEAQTPDMAKERAAALSKQFVMDCHTHFLRDDTRIMTFVRQREAVGKAGWNPALVGKAQTIEDLKFANYFKEVFLDSDTKVAMISGAPSERHAGLVPHQRDEGGGASQGQPRRGLPAHARPRDLHAGPARLARGRRSRHRRAQTGLLQGLHDRRQHPQADQQVPMADGRRAGRLQGVREVSEGGARQRVRAQGAVPAIGGEAVPAPPRPLRRARRRQGGEGLAAAELRHLSLRLSLPRRGPSRGRLGAVREDRTHRVGDRPRRESRASTA